MNEVEKLILYSGKSQKEAAEILGTTEATISRYKKAKHKISLETFRNWCELLNVDIKKIL